MPRLATMPLRISGFSRLRMISEMPNSPMASTTKIMTCILALENLKEVPGAHGIFTMSPTDHLGLDQRARVMVKIENGTWKYQP